ncbi:MAG: radical SAM protein [Nitrospirae bacterium]|nr:radical SAM protein [Nitrospirota bacterium]
MVKNIIDKSLSGEILNAEDIALLFQVPLFTYQSALIQSAARQICEKASNGLAEVHAQIGLDIAPCPRNCRFCSFASCNGVFSENIELAIEEVVNRAREFESDGANAIYLMTTSRYPFEKFIEVAQEVKRSLKEDTILVANIDDFSEKQALKLKDAGFSGVYHAVRMGEGRDTNIPTEKRLRTIRNAKEVGLLVGTCVEPIGPEHSIEELVEKTLITRDIQPVFSGAMRRIPIPKTDLSKHGIVSEAKMAHIVAVVRLATGYNIAGNCTHEPNVISVAAGSNLIWAETGSNPRDTVKETEGKRGLSVQQCRQIFKEAEWNVLSGPSKFFNPDSTNTFFEKSDLAYGTSIKN